MKRCSARDIAKATFAPIQRESDLNLLNNRPAADITDGDGDIDMMDVDDSWHDDEPLFPLGCIATFAAADVPIPAQEVTEFSFSASSQFISVVAANGYLVINNAAYDMAANKNGDDSEEEDNARLFYGDNNFADSDDSESESEVGESNNESEAANLRNQTNIDAPNQREEANNKNCYGTYNVSVPANHFNTIETYSIQFEEICTNGSVSRATQRTL